MAITPNFNIDDIKKGIYDKLERIYRLIESKLELVGEKFITNARNNANFTDRTGNLRASIGYAIYKDGVRVGKGFSSDSVGGLTAEVVAALVAKDFPTGFVLIFVAGMEYAAAVESLSFDVITSSTLIATDDLKKELAEINELIPEMN